MEISKDLMAASSTPIVLGILAEADSYGYAILQRVRELSGGTIERPANMDATMEFARDLCPADMIRYFEPGDVFRLPGTDFHGYVLGPPLPEK